MPEQGKFDLIYDPMPRKDVNFPPLCEPKAEAGHSKKLEPAEGEANVAGMLANLTFGS